MRSAHQSLGGIAASPASLINKRFTLPFLALLAVLAVGLLFLLPGGLLQAQDGDAPIEYAENGTDPVATYTGLDPEGRTVYWSLARVAVDLNDPPNLSSADPEDVRTADIADHGDFSISMDGVLTFKSPPSFESPNGGRLEADEGTPGSNTYKLVVVSSDDAPGATTDGEAPNMTYHKVTVMVTDVDEDGSISLSAQQPQLDVALTATLTDPDSRSTTARPIASETWKWEQSSAMDGPWSLISGAGAGDTDASDNVKASDSYTPAKDIAGMYLRATVTYTDKHGDDKTAMAVSAHMVRVEPAGTNASPEFPGATTNREVDENSPPGTAVGKPVTAGDAGDILTYSLNGDDDDYFAIDRATGQITVKKKLNFEIDNNANCQAGVGLACMVTVTATDPWGISTADATVSVVERPVMITINNVNEAPMITAGPTRDRKAENFDSDNETIGRQLVVAPYTVADNDVADTDATLNWSLTGPDAADFKIEKNELTADLSFKEAPNFEMPADANMDNMYMVTVVATDAKKLTAMRDVVITVTNANEPGSVTFSSVRPKVGVPFTASFSDPDGMATGVKWQWWRTTLGDPAIVIAFPILDAETRERPDWEEIDDAETDTYKPVSGDIDRGLAAVATYTDPQGSSKIAEDNSATPVIINTDNVAPEFREGGDKPVMQATRKIDENSVSDAADTPNPGNVGTSVIATDPNADPNDSTDSEGILTYALGGADKDSFEIDQETGQITVGADTKLDYESNKKTYMVTVTATDPSRAMTTIAVTIMVVDENEAPEFTTPSEGDVDKTVLENVRTLNIYTFQATDPERRKVYWSLSEDATDSPDQGNFTISDRGALSLNASPNYEDTGLDANKQYIVVVVASDDAPGAGINADDEDPIKTSMKTVTVTVTDMEETGTITLAPKNPHVGNVVTASLDDGDGEPGSPTWQWTVSSGEPEGGGANSNSYTPAEGDIGKTLQVKVTYEEGNDDKMVGPISAGRVQSAPVPANADPVFNPTSANRTVDENTRAGTRLGDAIEATDTDSLTYMVDNSDFRVSSSGQLSTAAMLNHEAEAEITVVVTATDPWGGSATITYTVSVEDVNEAPMINTGPTRKDHAEDISIDDLIGDYGAIDVDDGDGDIALTWSLEGEDSAKFNLVEADGMLTFKEIPNYEMPADRNKDNVYKVTVVVSDDGSPKLMDMRQVEVTVTDVEEGGTVTLSAVQPKTGIDLMASLTDPDNVTSTNTDGSIETGVTWQWWRTTSGDGMTVPDFPDAADAANWEKIADAKSDTYKPVSGDAAGTEGKWLTAMATYTDRRGSGKPANMSSDNAVTINNDNVAPMFKENNEEITETTRKVKEDAKPETIQGNVGAPVMFTDPNTNDLLTYTLSGPDAALFEITNDTPVDRGGGQISLRPGTKLDYEDRTTYMVTVTAADPDGESASVAVTIKVTDMDEAPEIIVGGLMVTGTSDINYAENGTGMVTTYSAAGPDAAAATWSLSGADAGDLSISSAGVLTFMAPPNYESPADANTDNIYMVMVNANDGTNDAMKPVSVRVTNEEEMGEVTLWAGLDALTMAPQVGDTITGAVMDPDGGVTVESWQWARTMDTANMSSWMDIQDATDAAYMVTEGDTGYHLRVMATYTDAAGTDMGHSMPTMMVTAVDEMMGEVTLWAGLDALTMAPQVGDTITGAVMDPDGGVTGETWQWARTMDTANMSSWMDIQGATNAAYTVMEGDTGYHLRVMATYTDAVGTDMAMVYSMPTMMVGAMAGDQLLAEYDPNGDGVIEKADMRKAVGKFFKDPPDLTREEMRRLVGIYFSS